MTYRKKIKDLPNNEMLQSGNKILPSLRVSSALWEKFITAIEKFNFVNLVEFDISTFHRIAIAYLSEKILAGEFEITFNVEK